MQAQKSGKIKKVKLQNQNYILWLICIEINSCEGKSTGAGLF
jgi:hypothetical protein